MQVLPILSSKRALWTLVVHRRRRRPPIFAILPPQPRNGRKSSSFPERNRNRLIGRAEIFIWHWNRNEEIALPAMHGRKSKTKTESNETNAALRALRRAADSAKLSAKLVKNAELKIYKGAP